jgi:hypothetical protein
VIHGITHARVTQILNLLKLLLAIWSRFVQMPADDQEYFSEKTPENCQTAIHLTTAGGIRSAEVQM